MKKLLRYRRGATIIIASRPLQSHFESSPLSHPD
jgi:hypothetical protein